MCIFRMLLIIMGFEWDLKPSLMLNVRTFLMVINAFIKVFQYWLLKCVLSLCFKHFGIWILSSAILCPLTLYDSGLMPVYWTCVISSSFWAVGRVRPGSYTRNPLGTPIGLSPFLQQSARTRRAHRHLGNTGTESASEWLKSRRKRLWVLTTSLKPRGSRS